VLNFAYLHRFASFVLHTPLLFAALFLVSRGIMCTVVEKLRPAREVDYRKWILRDLFATAVFGLLIIPGSDYVIM
jgi:hypothetical protein